MRIRAVFILVFCVLMQAASPCGGQTLSQKKLATYPKKPRAFRPFVGFDTHYGIILKHRPDFDLFTFEPRFMVDIKLGQQSQNTRVWQQAYRGPAYGVGVFYTALNHRVIGTPTALYGFYRFYLANSATFSFAMLGGVGIGGGFKPYNGFSNPDNKFIGTPFNFYFQVGPQLYWHLSPKLQINAGGHLKHFSNGGWRQPNLGINIIMANVGITYALGNSLPLPSKKIPLPKPIELVSVEVLGGIGTKHREGLRGNFPIYAFQAVGLYRTGHRSRVGLGFDAMYDNTLGRLAHPDQKAPVANQQMAYALTLNHDLMLGNLAVATQLGYYVHKHQQVNDNPNVYQRYVLKYRFLDHLLAYASLKVHGFQADYVEWGIGYRFGVANRKNGIPATGAAWVAQ